MVTEAATLPSFAKPRHKFPRGSISSDLSVGAHISGGSGVELIDPTQGTEWDSLLCSCPAATFFHGSAWARVLTKSYGHQPFYLHLSEAGKSVALVPLMEVASRLTGRRGVCLPFSDRCQPLLLGGASMESVLGPVRMLALERRWRYAEFRGAPGSTAAGDSQPTFYGHTLDLRIGAEALFARLDGSVRRAIRKARTNGLTVQVERTAEAIEQFIPLHSRTRRRHGVPAQPRVFFSQIYEQIIRPGKGFVVLARHGETAVAAAIFFVWGDKAIYKFGASDEAFHSLRGNNLVMWEAIRFLAESGVQELNLGRTAFDHDGLRQFKLGWGTTETAISYSRLEPASRTFVPVVPRHPRISARVFRRMPSIVNQMAGRLLYPHID